MAQDWLIIKKKQLDKLNSLDPKDKLEMLDTIALMDKLIFESCKQIAKLIYDPTLSNRLNEKDLKELYEKFRKFSLSYFKFDINSAKKLGLQSQEEKSPSPAHYT